jgi:hypothetical protein
MRGSSFKIIIFLERPLLGKKSVIAVRKGIPHNRVDLPSLASIGDAGLCVPIGISEVLLAAVRRSPCHTWNDAEIIDLLSFRNKSQRAGDLSAKHPFWNSIFSNHSGAKLPNLLHINEFEILGSRCRTH